MRKKYHYSRVRRTKYDAHQYDVLVGLGCPKPGSTDYYSYRCSSRGEIQPQSCVTLFSSLRVSAGKKFCDVQHFSLESSCHKAQEVLCVRTPHSEKRDVIIVRHFVGECPICRYHTTDQYWEDVQRRRRESP